MHTTVEKNYIIKYDLDKQHYTAIRFRRISISIRLQCDTDFILINKKIKLSDLDFRQNIYCICSFRSKPQQNCCVSLSNTQRCFVTESVFLDESSESMTQWFIHKDSQLTRF